jgi:hypothetical protein
MRKSETNPEAPKRRKAGVGDFGISAFRRLFLSFRIFATFAF